MRVSKRRIKLSMLLQRRVMGSIGHMGAYSFHDTKNSDVVREEELASLDEGRARRDNSREGYQSQPFLRAQRQYNGSMLV